MEVSLLKSKIDISEVTCTYKIQIISWKEWWTGETFKIIRELSEEY